MKYRRLASLTCSSPGRPSPLCAAFQKRLNSLRRTGRDTPHANTETTIVGTVGVARCDEVAEQRDVRQRRDQRVGRQVIEIDDEDADGLDGLRCACCAWRPVRWRPRLTRLVRALVNLRPVRCLTTTACAGVDRARRYSRSGEALKERFPGELNTSGNIVPLRSECRDEHATIWPNLGRSEPEPCRIALRSVFGGSALIPRRLTGFCAIVDFELDWCGVCELGRDDAGRFTQTLEAGARRNHRDGGLKALVEGLRVLFDRAPELTSQRRDFIFGCIFWESDQRRGRNGLTQCKRRSDTNGVALTDGTRANSFDDLHVKTEPLGYPAGFHLSSNSREFTGKRRPVPLRTVAGLKP
jgi:hypothetical protein